MPPEPASAVYSADTDFRPEDPIFDDDEARAVAFNHLQQRSLMSSNMSYVLQRPRIYWLIYSLI